MKFRPRRLIQKFFKNSYKISSFYLCYFSTFPVGIQLAEQKAAEFFKNSSRNFVSKADSSRIPGTSFFFINRTTFRCMYSRTTRIYLDGRVLRRIIKSRSSFGYFSTVISLIIEGSPDTLIVRFTAKPHILWKSLFH